MGVANNHRCILDTSKGLEVGALKVEEENVRKSMIVQINDGKASVKEIPPVVKKLLAAMVPYCLP